MYLVNVFLCIGYQEAQGQICGLPLGMHFKTRDCPWLHLIFPDVIFLLP